VWFGGALGLGAAGSVAREWLGGLPLFLAALVLGLLSSGTCSARCGT
jgi:hypothetical protein